VSEPAALCTLCKGPINMGEPVVFTANGMAHRFKTTCDYERQRIEEEDAKIMAELGVTL
jgi:hypothetical protein